MQNKTTLPAVANGRTAVITGSASGIGFAVAKFVASHGMNVAMIDLAGESLQEAQRKLAGSGAKVAAFGVDVSDSRSLVGVADRIANEMPPITFLMNNAGVGFPSSTLVAGEEWSRTLGVNLWGVINGTQAFVKGMIAHGEHAIIINTGSKQGITTPPGNPAYNISKAGVKVFTESLAHELRQIPDSKVKAHLLIPGWVHTGMTAAKGAPKPPGAWTPEQTVEFMFEALAKGDFYILCPDNETSRQLDEKRIAWAAGDIIENRPPLSRWHKDFDFRFKDWVKSQN